MKVLTSEGATEVLTARNEMPREGCQVQLLGARGVRSYDSCEVAAKILSEDVGVGIEV